MGRVGPRWRTPGDFWTIPLAAEGLAHVLYPGHAEIVRGNVTGRLRSNRLRRLCEAQRWACCYCYGRMRLPVECCQGDPDMATLEHLHRVTDGGGGRWDNLVAACAACNSHRGGFTPLKWWKVRQRLLPLWAPCTPMTSEARYNLRGYGALRGARLDNQIRLFFARQPILVVWRDSVDRATIPD
uniref:HNH domain-containing protein n=1 Tax=Caulobacter phage BL57 TaxID=3348355 RepID=A0AB74UHA1_9VIRU